MGNDMGPGPSELLRPEQAVVDFTGRVTELEDLRAWCEQDRPRSLRVLVGAGGVGKTRLALQIAAEWKRAGGIWQMIAAGHEARALPAARAVTSGAVLLVLDYAETRSGIPELLRAALDDPGPIRILMLARSLGEWWDRLVEESAPAIAQFATETEPIRLDAPVIADVPDADLAAAAMPFFARKLELVVPKQVDFELPRHRVPVLVLHAAALVAVLRMSAGPAESLRVIVTSGVFAELLEHEARYWRRTATAANLTGDGSVLKPVVAAAVLLGAADLEEATEVAGRVPDLAGAPNGELRRWARWLYSLYPAGPNGRLGGVQPDLLAETHAVVQLAGDPALAKECLRELTEDRAERALTVLARAWAHHEDAKQVIAAALNTDIAHLAVPASKVALQTSADVGVLLAEAVQRAPAPLDILIGIAQALPYPSVTLAQADLAVTMRIRSMLPPDGDPFAAAKWADRAGIRLVQLGRPAEAMKATQEAIEMYRELAEDNPERYQPDLAESLRQLGIELDELGRPAESMAVTEEAMALYRKLARDNPDQYRPALAASLSNLGVRFHELGRHAESLRVGQEAVTILRELAQADPDQYQPELAWTLVNLCALLSQARRLAESLQVGQESVAILRELAEIDPDRYRPALGVSLSNIGEQLSRLGRPAEAVWLR